MIKIKNLKAALFDLDGLIADTESLHVSSYHKMANDMGIKLNDEYIHSFIGVATKDNVKRIIKDFNINKNFEDVLKLRYQYYIKEIRNSNLKPMEGAKETIIFLRDHGLKTALVTSSIKEQAIEVLKKIFPDDVYYSKEEFKLRLFDFMIFGDDVKHSKPDPEIYIKASKLLRVEPNYCIVFEDSSAGVISAKSAGMYVIAVPNYHTKNQDFSKADYKINSLIDFQNLYK